MLSADSCNLIQSVYNTSSMRSCRLYTADWEEEGDTLNIQDVPTI